MKALIITFIALRLIFRPSCEPVYPEQNYVYQYYDDTTDEDAWDGVDYDPEDASSDIQPDLLSDDYADNSSEQ